MDAPPGAGPPSQSEVGSSATPDLLHLPVADVPAGTDETVAFGLDGRDYEIDLSDQDAERLRAEFAPYVTVARRVGGRLRRSAGKPAPAEVIQIGSVRR